MINLRKKITSDTIIVDLVKFNIEMKEGETHSRWCAGFGQYDRWFA